MARLTVAQSKIINAHIEAFKAGKLSTWQPSGTLPEKRDQVRQKLNEGGTFTGFFNSMVKRLPVATSIIWNAVKDKNEVPANVERHFKLIGKDLLNKIGIK